MSCPFFKPVALTASILGMLQGVAWSIMSFLAILVYAGSISLPAPKEESSLGYILTYNIHAMFTDSYSVDYKNNFLLDGGDLLIWSILYLILSLLWFGISLYLVIAVRGNFETHYKNSIISWSTITIAVCILDFSLTVAAGAQFGKFNLGVELQYFFEWVSTGVLMTVAARGFVLWIINLLLAIMLLKIMTKIVPEKVVTPRQQQPYQPNLYADSPWNQQQEMPRPHNGQWRNPVNSNNSIERSSERNYNDNRRFGMQNDGLDWDQQGGSIPRVNPMLRKESNQPDTSYNRYGAQNQPGTPSPDYSPGFNRPYSFTTPLKPAMKYTAPQPPRQLNRY